MFSVIFSLLGIYYYKAIFLIPNVVLKVNLVPDTLLLFKLYLHVLLQVMLSSSCLFYGLQLADSNDYSSACLFVWLLLSLVCFIWEIQAMFTATFGILKELNMKALSRPPPSYSQVSSTFLLPLVLSVVMRIMPKSCFSGLEPMLSNVTDRQIL